MLFLQSLVTQASNLFTWKELLGLAGAALAVVWIITIIFRTTGMVPLLEQAISFIIQQVCSLILAGFQLTFKLLQAVELYMVLLLDVLTGKHTSEQKVCVLASSALSIASFYTTYLGWCYCINNKLIAGLLTIGIQTLLLRTSLRIGLEMDWDSQSGYPGNNSMLHVSVAGIALLVLVSGGYIVNRLPMHHYYDRKIFNYVVVYFSLVLVIYIFFSFISSVSHYRMKDKKTARMLFTIYFGTLAVSSFFSFQAFFTTLYPQNIRRMDTFTEAKQSVVRFVSLLYQDMDSDFYQKLSADVQEQLSQAKDQLETSGQTARTKRESYISQYGQSYQEYSEGMSAIDKATDKIQELDQQLSSDKNSILGNTNNTVGFYTQKLINDLETKHDEDVRKQEDIIAEQKTLLAGNLFASQPALLAEYEGAVNGDAGDGDDDSLLRDIASASALLQKDAWSESDRDGFQESCRNIQLAYPEVSLLSGAAVLGEYKWFQFQYLAGMDAITKLHLNERAEEIESRYGELRNTLFENGYMIINSVPKRSYGFTADGQEIKVSPVNAEEYLAALEQDYADTNMDKHIFEQNLTSFWKKKVPGILSALIAVMVDNLILFVGFISPRQLEFFKNIMSAEPEKKRIVLEHLFSKPSKRA